MTSLSECKNPSASVTGNNVDMLIQILLRLPVTSLLVFKSVSKQWFSLISDPFFSHKYNLQNSPFSIQGLYTQTIPQWPGTNAAPELDYVPLDGSSCSAPFKTLCFIDDPLGVKIVQSCNGLMLCRSCCIAFSNAACRTYYICNPSTRRYRAIVCESQRHEKGFERLSSVSLAYDPRKSPHYKVVCIWLVSKSITAGNFNCQIEIYSSETASWKLSGELFSRPSSDHLDSGVFWNGSLHWTNTFKADSPFYFEVDRELRMEMEMPIDDKELGMEAKCLVECKGRLYLIVSHVYSPTSLQIFEMETDYKGWNMRYLVNLQELIIAYPGFYFDIWLVMDGDGDSPHLVLRVFDKVISYDLQDNSFEEIQQLAPRGRQYVAYQYIQSLACV